MLYYSEVQVGTPAQTLRLDLDTGSGDFWVFGAQLSRHDRKHHMVFDPKKSSTWESIPGATWSIQYGDLSSASGSVGTDVVNLGGIEITGQGIELAEKVSYSFVTGPCDGLLGLSFSSLNTVTPEPVLTPVDNMIKQGVVTEALFAAKLVAGDAGEYTFGYYDKTCIDGPVNWTPIDKSNGWWQVQSTFATINGKRICREKQNTAIMDTGTTLAIVSDDFLEQIYSAIPGAQNNYELGGWVFPESSAAVTVGIAIGDAIAQVPAAAVGYTKLGHGIHGTGFVYGAFQSRGEMELDVYGDVVLKHMLAIFDVGNERFGWARRIDVTYDAET